VSLDFTNTELLTQSTSLPDDSDTLTVACWIQCDVANSGDYNTVWSLEINSNTNLVLQTGGTTGEIYLWHTYNGGEYGSDLSRAISTGDNWYYVCIRKNADTVDMDTRIPSAATLTNTDEAYPSTAWAPTSLKIAEDAYGSEDWNGRICYFKMWNAVLSDAEVKAESLQAVPVLSLIHISEPTRPY